MGDQEVLLVILLLFRPIVLRALQGTGIVDSGTGSDGCRRNAFALMNPGAQRSNARRWEEMWTRASNVRTAAKLAGQHTQTASDMLDAFFSAFLSSANELTPEAYARVHEAMDAAAGAAERACRARMAPP